MTLVQNDRTKLTASYLNTAAGAVFGLAAPTGNLPTLTLGLGALVFRRTQQ